MMRPDDTLVQWLEIMTVDGCKCVSDSAKNPISLVDLVNNMFWEL